MRRARWSPSAPSRFDRLQGKVPVEAVNDPELNANFLAREVIWDQSGEAFWKRCSTEMRQRDSGPNALMDWLEFADRTGDEEQAWGLICGIADQEINRQVVLLGEHADLAAAEAAEQGDHQPALDHSPGLDRLRAHRGVLGRKYIRTMDTPRKMRSGGKDSLGHDSNRVNDQSEPDKNEILSHEETEADEGRVLPGAGSGLIRPGSCIDISNWGRQDDSILDLARKPIDR